MGWLDYALLALIGLVAVFAMKRVLSHKGGCGGCSGGCSGDCAHCAEVKPQKKTKD